MSRWPIELTAPRVLPLSPALHAAGATAALRVDTALAAWRMALDTAALPARSRVLCLLRDDLVRLRVLPWHDGLSSPPARQAHARQCFIDTFGEAARPWQVLVDVPHYGQPSLACAIDPRLLAGLDAELKARDLRQAGVQPALVSAFNRERPALPRQGAWLVLRHEAGLSLLLLQAGAPRHVKQVAGDGTALPTLIERESFALGLEGAPLPVHQAQAFASSVVYATPAAPVASVAPVAGTEPIAAVRLVLQPGRGT